MVGFFVGDAGRAVAGAVALSVGYPGWKTLDTQQMQLSQRRGAAGNVASSAPSDVAAEHRFSGAPLKIRVLFAVEFRGLPPGRALAAIGAGGMALKRHGMRCRRCCLSVGRKRNEA